MILSADTVIVFQEKVLEKPKPYGALNAEAVALEMLREMNGKSHKCLTAVAIFESGSVTTFVEETEISFFNHPDSFLSSYVATGEPLDKAGGYGIQGQGALLVESISGCYYNVVGLPLPRLFQHLVNIANK